MIIFSNGRGSYVARYEGGVTIATLGRTNKTAITRLKSEALGNAFIAELKGIAHHCVQTFGAAWELHFADELEWACKAMCGIVAKRPTVEDEVGKALLENYVRRSSASDSQA